MRFWKKRRNKEKTKIETFSRLLVECNALEFFGIAKLVGAVLVDEKKNMKKFGELIGEVLDCFCKLKDKEKDKVLAVLNELVEEKKKGGDAI